MSIQITTCEHAVDLRTARCHLCEKKWPSPTAQGPEDKCGTCGGDPRGKPVYGRVGVGVTHYTPCPDCTPSAKAGAVSEQQLSSDINVCDDMARYSRNGTASPETWARLAMLLRELRAFRSTPAPDGYGDTDAELRRFWLNEGGKFFGPNVEHGTMTEAKLLPLLRRLRSASGDAKP